MLDLLLSPYRRLRTRARASLYSASIDLAGRGLFWPVLALIVVAAAATIFFGWTPLTMFVYGLLEPWWVWIYLGMLAANAAAYAGHRTALRAVVLEWFIFYGIVGIPTLIWASYPGLGGGVQELSFWIVLFGALIAIVARSLGLGRIPDDGLGATVPFAVGGYIAGAVLFTIYHVAVHHPVPGDWWTAPLCSALAVVAALVFVRRAAGSGRAARS